MNDNISLLERVKTSPEAEREMVQNNMGLVRSLALRFLYSGVDYEDLCQIGSIGLIHAVRNFDTSRGVMFSTYAVPVIVGEIRRFLRDDGPVKVSRTLREAYVKIRRASDSFEKENERPPTLSELQAMTGLSTEEILTASEAVGVPVSLDEPCSDEDDSPLVDRLASCDHEKQMERMALKDSLNKLEPRDRQIIVLRYFGGKTQQEVSVLLGMTQVQVSRREKKIIESLRRSMT